MTDIIHNYEKHKRVYNYLRVQLKALEYKQKQVLETCVIEIKSRLYPGIDIEISHEKTRTKREYGPSKIRLLDSKLRIDPA